jgi:hypothetical protein
MFKYIYKRGDFETKHVTTGIYLQNVNGKTLLLLGITH